MGEDVKLLPCPFCGGKYVVARQNGLKADKTRAWREVACHDCDIVVRPFDDRNQAAIAWNRRAALPAVQGGVKVRALEFKQSPYRESDQIAHGLGVMYALGRDHKGVIASMNEGSCRTRSYHDNMEQAIAWANEKERNRILAALEPAAPQGWQPIETAPKDGTQIDVWCPDADDGYRVADAWVDHAGNWRCCFDNNVRWARQPTHWQPLPVPPDVRG